MKIKKAIICVACLIGICSISAIASEYSESESFDFPKWGQILKNDAEESSELRDRTTAEETLVQGNEAAVSESDVDMGTQFYQAAGFTKEDAREQSVEYFKEYEAMYAEAIAKGYSVTDEEIEDYLEEMKASIFSDTTDETTQEQYREMFGQFDSEEDYWNYEKEVYRKQLPIEKMVRDLEREYFGQESADEEGWDEYFENYKADLVRKQNYQNYAPSLNCN